MHFWAFIGSLLLASGVAMGAYGAHGLRAIVDVPRSIEAFEYAVQYQLLWVSLRSLGQPTISKPAWLTWPVFCF